MRQFLALPLPAAWQQVLDERRREWAPRLEGWRWLPTASIHLTLRFLGDVAAEADSVARGAWAEAVRAQGRFELRLATLGSFPPGGRRPRILWAGVRPCRRLAALVDALESAAERLGFAPPDKAFRPHLTLARARRGVRATLPGPAALQLPDAAYPVTEVILFQSVLDRSGARYTALESYRLAADR